jgi:hypothetical protein
VTDAHHEQLATCHNLVPHAAKIPISRTALISVQASVLDFQLPASLPRNGCACPTHHHCFTAFRFIGYTFAIATAMVKVSLRLLHCASHSCRVATPSRPEPGKDNRENGTNGAKLEPQP